MSVAPQHEDNNQGLLVAGVLFGLAYGWAALRLYRPEVRAGFWLGSAHGALMPIALPSLLVGKDVPIFTANNTGRAYKLGYIAGINLCGLVFFGLAFRGPCRISNDRIQRGTNGIERG